MIPLNVIISLYYHIIGKTERWLCKTAVKFQPFLLFFIRLIVASTEMHSAYLPFHINSL